jgi:tripartite-type tricarboxylate transporter receptor subunit TctC
MMRRRGLKQDAPRSGASILSRRWMLAGAILAPLGARASELPAGTITFVVPFAAGGSVDAIARILAVRLQPLWGRNVVVENKPGASGSTGAAQVARARPDGSQWLFVFDTHAVNPALLPSLPFNTETDLLPVTLIGTAPHVVATSAARPFASFSDVIAAAKPNPGSLTYGSPGVGSLSHLTMVLLAKQAGVQLTHVPYRGGGPALNDALGGQIDLVIGSAALTAAQIQAGQLRGLLQTGPARLPSLPQTATAAEAGFPNFESNAWWGIFAPRGTPGELVDRMNRDVKTVLEQPDARRAVVEGQQVSLRLEGPNGFSRFFNEQMRTWGAVVRENGIRSDS